MPGTVPPGLKSPTHRILFDPAPGGTTHHLEQGSNLLVIQRLMGHSDLSNTLKYLHVQQLDTEKVVNPLDKLEGLEGLCKSK